MRIIIKDVIKLLKGYSKQQVLGIVLTVLCTVSTIAAPIASSYLIDKVIPSYDMKQLIYGIGIFFVICLLNPLFSYPRSSIYNKMTQDITASLREMLFEKVILAPMSFFDQHQNGEIINHVLNDSQQMGQFITNFFTNYIMDIGLIVMSLIGMIFISPSVSGLAIIVFALAFLCNELFRKRMSEVSHKIQKDYDALNVDISQAVNIVETIKSYTLEANVIKHYLGNVKACKDDCVKVNQYNIKINTFMQSIYVVCICLIYGFGTYRVMNKQMTLGEVVAINLLFQNFISPIYSLANNLVAINQIRPVFNRVFEYLNMQQEPLKLEEDSKEIIKGPIQIQDVKFRYKKMVGGLSMK
ncbi:ABC transporter transmembrane domain-containing protein [Cellulosilyticum ruminicola]|uniref:ABC transporter transmembrane domain-containing protein n=1 Tax=Cellulosilyticum ruminicola TaxID=425254 RepID=UPI0006D046A7|nr:ABC transporter ATP-binding protein [Cellulosilyticum ruminicola]